MNKIISIIVGLMGFAVGLYISFLFLDLSKQSGTILYIGLSGGYIIRVIIETLTSE